MNNASTKNIRLKLSEKFDNRTKIFASVMQIFI